MQTNLFVKWLGEAVNKMAKEGAVYVHKTEISHKTGRYQTVKTALVSSPKEALDAIGLSRRNAEKAGVPWKFDVVWKDRELEIGETEVMCEVTITHKNGEKSGRVDYITRVR